MIIEKLYEANKQLTAAIISYAKNILLLPAEIFKSHDIIVVSIIEDYLYNHHNIMIVISPKSIYIYKYENLIYECENSNTFTSLDLKKDLILLISNNYISD